jgi:hypothetical protein
MDVHSKTDLEKSLARWKRQLAKQEHSLSVAQRASASARRGAQEARALIERRESQLAKVPEGGRRKAVDKALVYVGTTEHPPGSNRGLYIDQWQGRFHMRGQPWCGAFVGAMCEMAGAKLTARIVYTPYIFTDANAHANGLNGVVWQRGKGFLLNGVHAHSADLVLFDFGTKGIKHVGMLVKPYSGGRFVQTVEGNTSFGDGGSQDNGGAVARRKRDIGLVHSIVRVKWS